MRFAYKHVRNNHEKSGSHIYTCVSLVTNLFFFSQTQKRLESYMEVDWWFQGDFVEADEDFTSRPRGGVKRKHVTAEMLIRKRVMPPQFDS